MKHLLFALILLSTVLVSCKNEDTPKFQSIDLVTGLRLVDDNGQPLGFWNVPNENPGEVLLFPNPMRSFFFLSSQVPIATIWIIPADCDADDNASIAAGSLELSYPESQLDELEVLKLDLPAATTAVSLNIENLSVGFYKVFYELENGETHWGNIYRADDGFDLSNPIEALDSVCE